MAEYTHNTTRPSQEKSLAGAFARLGWLGFWVQIAFGTVTIVFIIYYLSFSSTPGISRSGLPLVEYMTTANLLVLLFTIFWSYRYTRLSKRMADPTRAPSESQLTRIVWIGVAVITLGMLFSLLVLTMEVSALMFYFLRAPQGGIPVVQTSGNATYWVSSVDMVSLMALTLTLLAELIVLIFNLCLLYRMTRRVPGQVAPA